MSNRQLVYNNEGTGPRLVSLRLLDCRPRREFSVGLRTPIHSDSTRSGDGKLFSRRRPGKTRGLLDPPYSTRWGCASRSILIQRVLAMASCLRDDAPAKHGACLTHPTQLFSDGLRRDLSGGNVAPALRLCQTFDLWRTRDFGRVYIGCVTLDFSAILWDGSFPVGPLANASILESKKHRDYFGLSSRDKMPPPPPYIRCYSRSSRNLGIVL
jgi:hypothetical protein